MKRIIKLSLFMLLIFGLTVSFTPAAQETETPNVLQEDQSGEIKELTIRNSGFLSKSDIVIRYRDADKKIIEVIENGKKLPPSEFPRYESLIREVLEIPQIDRLVPEIERAKRRAESARISEESKIREMLELRRRLETLDSERARRYRDINELMLMEELNSMTERISESKELSQEEKIVKIRGVLEKINAQKFTKQEDRRRMMAELGATNAARRLIEELSRSTAISNEEKIAELNQVLRNMREMEVGIEGRRNLLEVETAQIIRKMLQEVVKNKELSDSEREKEFEKLLQQAKKMQMDTADKMIDVEKFKFELQQLLKNEGQLPEGEAKFILKMNECSIDGKKLSKEIHSKILRRAEQILGNKFSRDTQIILRLNENR